MLLFGLSDNLSPSLLVTIYMKYKYEPWVIIIKPKDFCDISNKILQGEVSINPWTGPWTVVFGGSVLLQGVYECHRGERRHNTLSASASNKVAATVAAAAAVHLTRDPPATKAPEEQQE